VIVVDRITHRYERGVARARERSELVDHLFRAKDRYADAFGGRLAAAIAYYGFFATFALGILGYSVLGLLLERQVDLQSAVDDFLQTNLPVLQVDQISGDAGTAGVFGLVALVFAGVAWVETLRSSQRRIWELEQKPGNVFVRRALDVPVLVGLSVLLGASVAAAAGIEWLVAGVPVLRHFGWVLMLGINLLLVVAMVAALPRLRISWNRLLPPAAVVAVGIFVLNELGGIYIDRVQRNPAYAVVASAAGLLVYLYLFNQLLLAGAAWAATSSAGRVVDLADRDPSGAPSPPATPGDS
jgi:membrane protein